MRWTGQLFTEQFLLFFSRSHKVGDFPACLASRSRNTIALHSIKCGQKVGPLLNLVRKTQWLRGEDFENLGGWSHELQAPRLPEILPAGKLPNQQQCCGQFMGKKNMCYIRSLEFGSSLCSLATLTNTFGSTWSYPSAQNKPWH